MAGGRAPVQQGDAMQQQIARLLETFGFTVFTLGTRQSRGRRCPGCGTFVTGSHGTRQTPGAADLMAFSRLRAPGLNAPMRRVFLFVESKAGPHARLNPEQRAFLALCEEAAVHHVVGDLDAVIAWLCAQGFARPDQFPHYRQPKGAAYV